MRHSSLAGVLFSICLAGSVAAQQESAEAQVSRAAARYLASTMPAMVIGLDTMPTSSTSRVRTPGALTDAALARELGASKVGTMKDFVACPAGTVPRCTFHDVDAVVRLDQPNVRDDVATVHVSIVTRGASARRATLTVGEALTFTRRDGQWTFVARKKKSMT
jgi:hypothetical protein